MRGVIPFEFRACQVRVVQMDGEPWFVARDVAGVLGYSEPHKAVRVHCKTLKILKGDDLSLLGLDPADTPRGLGFIAERDVYRQVMRSRLPEAERFVDWVTAEVLPAIRRTGAYGDVARLSRRDILQMALEAEDARLKLEQKVQADAPKVEFHDRVTAARGEHSIDQAAKVLGTGQRRLFRLLRDRKVLRPDNLPYQQYIDRGLFRVAEKPYLDAAGNGRLSSKTVVTGKGLVYLQRLLSREVGQVEIPISNRSNTQYAQQ